MTTRVQNLLERLNAVSSYPLLPDLGRDVIAAAHANPHDSIVALLDLYQARKLTPLVGALEVLGQAGITNPVLDLADAHASLRLGMEPRFLAALDRLRRRDLTPDPPQDQTIRHLLTSVVGRDIANAFVAHDNTVLAGLVDLASLLDPSMLDPPPVAPSRGRLFDATPPLPHLHDRPKILVFGRPYMFGPGSRPFDLGPRLANAARRAGWNSTLVGIEDEYSPRSYRQFCAAAAEIKPDIAVYDNFGCTDGASRFEDMVATVADLRRAAPGCKFVALYTDPWIPFVRDVVIAANQLADALWSPLPELDLWFEVGATAKLITIPFPLGVDLPVVAAPQHQVGFVGGVTWYNWHRAVWFDRLTRDGYDVSLDLSTHSDDGLDPLVSYGRYLERLADAKVILNFSTRSNRERTITARTFEALAIGRLLLQEDSPDLPIYLVPGEECLTFRSIADLERQLDIILAQPERVQAIAAAGRRRFEQNYGDHATFARLAVRLGLTA